LENLDISKVVITFVVFLFSTSCHEAAHASVAYWWGDSTGRDAGQMSLNPFPHIQREPFGMLLLPLLMLFQSGGSMLMGWASTPVNPSQMRDTKWGSFWTSAAGPLTNLLLALVFLLLLKISRTSLGASLGDMQDTIETFLWTGVWLNIVLTVLNFLPIPSLDGGNMLEVFLPYEAAQLYGQVRPFGFMILLVLGMTGMFSQLVTPLLRLAAQVVR
jgi:Zn-dependent protease